MIYEVNAFVVVVGVDEQRLASLTSRLETQSYNNKLQAKRLEVEADTFCAFASQKKGLVVVHGITKALQRGTRISDDVHYAAASVLATEQLADVLTNAPAHVEAVTKSLDPADAILFASFHQVVARAAACQLTLNGAGDCDNETAEQVHSRIQLAQLHVEALEAKKVSTNDSDQVLHHTQCRARFQNLS